MSSYWRGLQVLRIAAKRCLGINARIGALFTSPLRAIGLNRQESQAKMPSSASNLILKYTKIVPEAFPPTKGSLKAAGYDLKSVYNCTVPARGKALVDTGIKVQLPEGCYGRIAPRSGLAVKNFIDVGGKFCYIKEQSIGRFFYKQLASLMKTTEESLKLSYSTTLMLTLTSKVVTASPNLSVKEFIILN